MKEKAIGILFAAGTTLAVVGQLPGLTISFGAAVILFTPFFARALPLDRSVGRELDTAQGKASFVTGWPAVARALTPIGYVLTLVALGCATFWWFAFPLWLCLAVSSLLLVRLNTAERLRRDSRTALADLVLLTPLAVLLISLR